MSGERMNNWVVIYHTNCCDGLAAMLVAEAAHEFLTGASGDDSEFMSIPFQYKWKLSQEQLDAMYNKDVFILDFSFSPKDMEQIRAYAANVVMLDHHETAADMWGGYRENVDPGVVTDIGENPKEYRATLRFKLDKCRSGATLAYQYFRGLCKGKGNWLSDEAKASFKIYHPNTWEMCRHAEDRDLFSYILKDTRAWHMLLDKAARGKAEQREELTALIYGPSQEFQTKLQEKQVLVEDYLTRCKRYAYKAQPLTILGIKACVLNVASDYTSDTAAFVYQVHPTDPVLCWVASTEQVFVSVRSGPGAHVSARTIAEYFGGGGHEQAAGFTLKPKQLPQLLDGSLKPTLLDFIKKQWKNFREPKGY